MKNPVVRMIFKGLLLTTKIGATFILMTALSSAMAASAASEPDHTINLESSIVGDKEQPAVSYFIPWKDVGTPEKLQWNIDRKYDDTLELLDRNVMLRTMQVYQQMNMESPD